jgi:hypothetical protein
MPRRRGEGEASRIVGVEGLGKGGFASKRTSGLAAHPQRIPTLAKSWPALPGHLERSTATTRNGAKEVSNA